MGKSKTGLAKRHMTSSYCIASQKEAHSLLYRHTRFELPYIQSHPLDHIISISQPHTLQFPPATPFDKMATDSSPPSSTLNTSTLTLIILTALLALGGGIYLSGAGDSIGKYLAEQFFRGKATAEKKALEHVGEEKARGFLYVFSLPCHLMSSGHLSSFEAPIMLASHGGCACG